MFVARHWFLVSLVAGLAVGGCAHGSGGGGSESDPSAGAVGSDPSAGAVGAEGLSVDDPAMLDVRAREGDVESKATTSAEPSPEPSADPAHAISEHAPREAEGEVRLERSRDVGAKRATAPGTMARPMRGTAGFVPADAPPVDREGYDHLEANRMVAVADEPLSTFGVDVDTASYANVRRFLTQGALPPPSAVRVEEMINYFRYDYAEPSGDEAFSITTSLAGCPWAPEHRLLQIGVRAEEVDAERLPPRNLVFLVDVSGSMFSADKLPLLKRSFALLVDSLREEDKVAMVVYAGSSGLVLPPTPGSQRERILAALERLEAGGSTNGGQGIELAYQVAAEGFVPGGVNRVILASDGDFNVGVSSRGELERLIETKRQSGVFLSVLGFGQGNLQDSTMEMLARKGNGNYAYIDSIAEAKKVLVREAGSTLHTVAKDVKIQVEWNPAHVESYRLIGYENRMLAARDFNDDAKDAGDIGAGHTVTALYEVVPAGAGTGAAPKVDPLRYAHTPDRGALHEGELATVKVRFKAPDGAVSRLVTRPVAASARASSDDLRFAAAVAGFGLWLRNDAEVKGLSLSKLRALAESGLGRDPHGDRRGLLALMDAAARLAPHRTAAPRAL